MCKKRINFILTGCLLTWSLFSGSLVFAEEAIEYRFERLWPRLEQPWYFNVPSDIAIAPEGSIYVADRNNHRIQQFSADWDFIRAWGKEGSENGQFKMTGGLAIAPEGSVYVVDHQNHRIQQFNAQGDFIQTWGGEGSSNGQFNEPEGIAIAKDGSIYIVDKNNHRIQQFNAQGTFIRAWGTEGSGNGRFHAPTGIAIASNGSIYITDSVNHRIQQFNAQGDFIRTWGTEGSDNGQFNLPYDIEISSDNSVYVSDQLNNRIQQFNAQGEFIQAWGYSDSGNVQLASPKGLAIALDGSIYVTDRDNRIQQFSAQGEIIKAIESTGAEDGQFSKPKDIALAPDGSSYITDTFNRRIQQFNAQGEFIRLWGSHGTDDGQFGVPTDIAVAQDGSVFVTDSDNDRIQQFSAEGDFIQKWDFKDPSSIAIAPDGNVFVTDSENDRIQQFGIQGDLIRAWGAKGSGDGQFNAPSDIAIAPSGDVYVVDSGNARVQQFSPQGDFIRILKKGGLNDGQIHSPSGIAIAADGRIYIVDTANHQILQFNAQGEFVETLGNLGSGDGQFSTPEDIAISANGEFYVVDTGNNRIQKFSATTKATSSAHPYKAIILAGGGKTIAGHPNHIWDGTKRVTQKAYKALTSQAFKQHEEIKFLTAGSTQVDLDNNNKFDDFEAASKESLRLAITQWATDSTDVVIYLANHGGPGKFQVNDTEILTGEELSAWVSQLEPVIPGKVTIIIEACNSASFFNHLSKPNRYLFASAKADQPAVISNDGLNSFSYYFWSEIATGAPLKSAFTTAKQGMSKIQINTLPQDAQADVNGKRVNLEALGTYCLGNCNKTATTAPSILPISPNNGTLNGEITQGFTMTVNHLQPLSRAWALIQRPGDISIDLNKPINFEKISLSCNKQSVCQGSYDRFDYKGEYRVSFYAMDNNGDVSFPETVIINQSQGKTVIPTFYDDQSATLYLRDVVVNGQHFQAALELQGDKFVLIAYSEAAKQFLPAAQFDSTSSKLSIPHALVFGEDYQAAFNHLGGSDFKLESAVPK